MKKFALLLCAAMLALPAFAQTVDQAALNNIMTRSSIRRFQKKAVSKEIETILLKAAMAAPTAMNRQPWAFIVVRDPATLKALAAAVPGAKRPLATAPMAIVTCGDMSKAIPNNTFWTQDLSAATENILLAVNACKLGAVWCGVYPIPANMKNLSAILKTPKHIVPFSLIAIGSPEVPQKPKNKWNPALVHQNVW